MELCGHVRPEGSHFLQLHCLEGRWSGKLGGEFYLPLKVVS